MIRRVEIQYDAAGGEAVGGASWTFPTGAPPALTARPSLVRGVWNASVRVDTADKTITVPLRLQVDDGPVNAEVPLD